MNGSGHESAEKGLKALKGVTIGILVLTITLGVVSFLLIALDSGPDSNEALSGIGSTLCSLTMCLGTFLIPLLIIYAIVKATMQNKGKTGQGKEPSKKVLEWKIGDPDLKTSKGEAEKLRNELEELKEKVERANQLETAGSHVLAAEIYGKVGLKDSAAMVKERMHRLRRMAGSEGAGILERLERDASKDKASKTFGTEGSTGEVFLPIPKKALPKDDEVPRKRERSLKMAHRPMVTVIEQGTTSETETIPSPPPDRVEGSTSEERATGPERRVVICPNCKAASELEVVHGQPVLCQYCGTNI